MNAKTKKNLVKLYVYQKEGEKTYVDSFERESFDDFILVTGDFNQSNQEEIEDIYNKIKTEFDKTVLMIDKQADISFYGIKEV